MLTFIYDNVIRVCVCIFAKLKEIFLKIHLKYFVFVLAA